MLLDSVQSGQCERLPGAAAMIRDTTERLAICRRTAHLHLAHLLLPVPASTYELPEPVQPAVKTFLNSPVHLEAMQMEAEWFPTMKQLDGTRSIRALPLLVLSSDVSGGPVRREWMPYWREMQKDLGMLSDQSEVRVVPGADHETMVTNEARAVDRRGVDGLAVRGFDVALSPASAGRITIGVRWNEFAARFIDHAYLA